MFIFKPVFSWVLKYHKNYQHIKSSDLLGYEAVGTFSDGMEDENLKGNLDGL